MNLYKKNSKTRLASIGAILFAIACATVHSQTTTDIDRTIDPDGTIHEKISTETETTSNPVGGTFTVNAAGLDASVGFTFEDGNGQTTETDVPEGVTVEVPEDTESVTTETETTGPCPACGEEHNPRWNPQTAQQSAQFHRLSPYEFRVGYRAWPDPLLDVVAAVSVEGHGPTAQVDSGGARTPRHVVKAHASEIGAYFRQGQMVLLPNGTPVGASLPSFPDADVHVREVLYLEATATGANFHFYDILPFQWIQFTLNGNAYSLQTPGAVNPGTPFNGWYHAIVPVPASELALYTTYDSTIKKEGSDDLGGRSMVLDLELL